MHVEFGSVPNLSNYVNFFINLECLLSHGREECCHMAEKNVILFIFGTVITYHALLMLVN